MTKLHFALAAIALLCLNGARAHTYFKADLEPFGDPPSQPDAAAVLDFLTHQGEAMWTFNITNVANATVAQIVFGDPEVYGEPLVTFWNATAADGEPLTAADRDGEGMFDAADFTPEYRITMNGLMAHAGLGHLWAVVRDTAEWNNIILAGKLENYHPAHH